MVLCEYSSNRTGQVALLYVTQCLAFCAALAWNVYFSWKWHTQLNSEDRRKTIYVLSAIIVTSITLANGLKIIELSLWYKAHRIVVSVLFHMIVFVSTFGVQLSLFALIIYKLVSTFELSKYRVSKREVNELVGLTVATQLILYVFLILTDIRRIKTTAVGQLVMIIIGCCSLFLGLLSLFRVNVSFSGRLRQLISYSTSIDPDRANKLGSMPIYISSIQINRMISQTTVDGIRKATVSDFASNQQVLLRTSARELVTSLWISVAFLLLFLAALIGINARCANWSSILSQMLLAVVSSIITAAVSMDLPHFSHEYRLFCRKFDKAVQKYLAWESTKSTFHLINPHAGTRSPRKAPPPPHRPVSPPPATPPPPPPRRQKLADLHRKHNEEQPSEKKQDSEQLTVEHLSRVASDSAVADDDLFATESRMGSATTIELHVDPDGVDFEGDEEFSEEERDPVEDDVVQAEQDTMNEEGNGEEEVEEKEDSNSKEDSFVE